MTLMRIGTTTGYRNRIGPCGAALADAENGLESIYKGTAENPTDPAPESPDTDGRGPRGPRPSPTIRAHNPGV